MKKIFQMTPIIGIVVAIILALPNIVQFFHKDTIKLNIQKISEVQLAVPLGVDGLVSQFIYNDSIKVDYLWQTTFKIEHIGNKTIYSNEFKDAALIDNYIPFTVVNDGNLLDIKIVEQDIDATLAGTNHIIIKQWRPKEFIEITILSASEMPPHLNISDRYIKNAEISQTEFDPKDGIRNDFIFLSINILYLLIIAVMQVVDLVEYSFKNKKIKTGIFIIIYFLYIIGVIIYYMLSLYNEV